MFEFLFAQSSAIARYRSAPLLEERIRYLAHCKQIGIKLETLRIPAAKSLLSRGYPTSADCDSILPGADSRRGGSDGPATHDYADGAYCRGIARVRSDEP